jgi:hypothetical protein
MPSHAVWQQKESFWQIARTHGSHPNWSGEPAVHRLWAHGPLPLQTPFVQEPPQH